MGNAINERGLINGIGYNLARLVVDEVSFEDYVNLTKRLCAGYLSYNGLGGDGLPANKVAQIADVNDFYHITRDFIFREGIYFGPDNLIARARGDRQILDIMVDSHLVLSQAHALYFLGHGLSLAEHMETVQEILDYSRDLNPDIASMLAREKLDEVVIENLRKLKEVSKQRYRNHRMVGVG